MAEVEVHLMQDILIILGLSVAVIFLFQRLRIPAVIGFLLTGVVAGPHGLGSISSVHEVEILAEVGVVLLLFTIGIEFSLDNLLRIRKKVLVGGSLQVLITTAGAAVIAQQLGQPPGEAVFIGFLVALSSTAIVLKLLQDRAEIASPHGQTALAILIFQDIVIVPMILFTPILAGTSGDIAPALFILLAKGAAVIGITLAAAWWIVPNLLFQIARTRSRELFLLSVIFICLIVAWLTHKAGLSLALGAFLAGLIISQSEYSLQAFGNVLPFRDLFASFFFVSIGMLLDIGFVFAHVELIALVILSVLILKFITGIIPVIILGYPFRTALMVGFVLCQVGEFSFILSTTGEANGFLAGIANQLFLSGAVLTMAVTPFIITLAPRLADRLMSLPIPAGLRRGFKPIPKLKTEEASDHLIIIGFGVTGRNVARAAHAAGIPYVIIELNPDTVRLERAKGENIIFGDAAEEAVLNHAGIGNAIVVVVAVPDAANTKRITVTARRLNPKAYLIIRTRFLQEMQRLYDLGADEVIPEEFETSVEIFARVLTRYLIPRDEIERLIAEIRAAGYEMFRSLSAESTEQRDLRLHIPHSDLSTFRVCRNAPIAGKSIAETVIDRTPEIKVLAVVRDSEILPGPNREISLAADDIVYILGPADTAAGIAVLFKPPPGETDTQCNESEPIR